MSTHALRTSDIKVWRYTDLIVLLLALPLFLLTGLPFEGWAGGALAYVAQRLIGSFAESKARDSEDPKVVAGWMTGGVIARGWLVALMVFGTGIAFGDSAGLSAAVLFLATFTISFPIRMVAGR